MLPNNVPYQPLTNTSLPTYHLSHLPTHLCLASVSWCARSSCLCYSSYQDCLQGFSRASATGASENQNHKSERGDPGLVKSLLYMIYRNIASLDNVPGI